MILVHKLSLVATCKSQHFSIYKSALLNLKPTIIFNVVIKIFPGNSWPDTDIKIFRMVIGNRIHLGQVEADSAVKSRNSGFESRAGPVWNYWNVFRIAKLADLKKEFNLMGHS